MEWSILESTSGFSPGIVYLSGNEAIVPVTIGKKEFGISRINNTGKIIWQTAIPERIIGIGKLSDKLLVFFRKESPKSMPIQVAVLSVEKGNKISEKVALEDPNDGMMEVLVEKTPVGDFKHLLVRTSGAKGPYNLFQPNRSERYRGTMRCAAVFFDENGNKTATVNTNFPDGSLFFGSQTNAEGDIFILYKLDESLVMAKYSEKGELKNKLQTSLATRKGKTITPTLILDANEPDKLWASISYTNSGNDEAHQAFGFDFKSNKVITTSEELLDKSYSKTVELQEVPGIMSGKMKEIGSLKPIGIVPLGDKVIVLKESTYSYSIGSEGANRAATNGLYVSFYDKQLKPLKTICLDKRYEAFLPVGLSTGYKLREDKLYITTTALKGVASYANLLCALNTTDMKFEKIVALDKGAIGADKPIEAAASLWFDNSLLVNYITVGGLMTQYRNTALQRVSFQ